MDNSSLKNSLKNTFETVQNLRTLIKTTLITVEQSARESKDLVDVEALRQGIESLSLEVSSQTKTLVNKLLDSSLEIIDKQDIKLSKKDVETRVRDRIRSWRS